MIAAAKRDREEAARLLDQHRAALDASRGEAQKLIADARVAAERVRSELVEQAHAEQATVLEIIGDVVGRTALIVDDFIISGGTLVSVAEKLLPGWSELGSRTVPAGMVWCWPNCRTSPPSALNSGAAGSPGICKYVHSDALPWLATACIACGPQ